MKVASHSNMNLLMQNLCREQMIKSGHNMMEESLPEKSSGHSSFLECGKL